MASNSSTPDSQSSEGQRDHVGLEKSANLARRGGRRIPGPGKRLGRPPGGRNKTKAELEEEVRKKLREKAEILQLRQQLRQGVHRLNWEMHAEPTEVQSGESGPSAVVPPWRLSKLPASLSGTELLDLLAQARANRERDWLMILVAAWHGLSAAEVVGFKADAVQNGDLTIRRIKGTKTTVQPLVSHKNPLLNEKAAPIDFTRETPPGRPVFDLSTKTFTRIVQRYGKAAGISQDRATPRVLKHSMAIQSMAPRSMHTVKSPGRRGRQEGAVDPCTPLRIRLFAAFELRGTKSAPKIGPALYPRDRNAENVKGKTRMFHRRHKAAIEKQKESMTSLASGQLQGEIDRLGREIHALDGRGSAVIL